MVNKSWFHITLFIFGAMFGSVFGFWTTLGLLASILILLAAKDSWQKGKSEPEPQPV